MPNQRLEQTRAAYVSETTETFPDMLRRLYEEQYTGPLTLQFGQGVPSCAEFPQSPRRVKLDKELPQSDT